MRDESQALEIRQNGSQALDFGIQAVVSVDQALKRIKEIQHFISTVMVKGEDYGVIPGTGAKPTLLKPGAEKLCEMYGLTPTFDITDSIRDWEAPFFHYEIRCRLVSKNTGVIMGEGLGSCNSREKRYRNQDTYSIANTILKMAKKRAHVDAALSATRSSGIFTQDIEDFADDAPRPAPQVVPARPIVESPGAAGPGRMVSRKDLATRYAALVDRADGLEVPAKMYDPGWTDQALIDEGQALNKLIIARENQLAKVG